MAGVTTANLVANVYANVSGFISGLSKASQAAAKGAVAIDAAGLAAVDLTAAMSAAGAASAANAAALATDATAAAGTAGALDVTAGSALGLATTMEAVDLTAGVAAAALSAEAVASAELALAFDAAAIAAAELALAEGTAGTVALTTSASLKATAAAAVATGKSITMAFAPLLVIGGLAMKMSMEYNSAIGKIRRLTANTAEDVDKMSEAILKIAVASGKGPKELADAMFLLASSGLSANKAIAALEMSAQASAIGLGDMAIIADGVASAMNAYATTGLSARDATNALINAVKVGKMPSEDLTKVLGTIIPIAANMGMTFQEVTSDIASLTQVGVPATRAATGLRAVLMSLLSPTKEAAAALGAAGFSSEQLQVSIKNKGLFPTLMELKSRTDGSTSAMQKMIPESRALSAVLGLTGANSKNAASNFEELQKNTDTLAKGMADLASKPGFKMKQAMEEINGALIKLGDSFMPMFGKAATAIGGLFKLIEKIPKPVLGILAGFSLVGIQAGIFAVALGKVAGAVSAVIKALEAGTAVAAKANWIVLLAVGAAILTTAFMALSKGTKANKTEVDALTESYRVQLGVIDKTAAAVLYSTIQNRNQDDDLRRIQKSLGTNGSAWKLWIAAVGGSKDAAQKIRKALVDSGDAVNYFQKGTDQYKKTVADFIKTGNLDWTSGNLGILKTLQEQQLASKDSLAGLNNEAKNGKAAFEQSGEAINAAGESVASLKAEMDLASAAGETLKTVFDALFGGATSLVEAEIAARASVKALIEAMKTGDADSHITAMIDTRESYEQLAAAQLAAGKSTDEVNLGFAGNLINLFKTSKAAGATGVEFGKLAQSMNLPESVVIAMSAPGADVIKLLMEQLPGIIAQIPKVVPISVPITVQVSDLIKDAKGNVTGINIGGGRRLQAAGGIMKKRTDVTVGEAGPEAIIPLGASPAARKNRANVMAAAGLGGEALNIGVPGGGGGTANTYNVTVNVPATADPAKVGQAVVDSLVAWSRRNGAIPVAVSG